jgi:DNA-dependent RNA polymerase auxiliary subunit epsilon
MKIYYSFDTNRIMTEEEATKYIKEELSNDDYGIWEFISDNYFYEEIIEKLSQDFLKEITEEISDDDDYDPWDFISDNYFYEEIIEKLSQDFLKGVTEKLIKNRLENPGYFLVREFPD